MTSENPSAPPRGAAGPAPSGPQPPIPGRPSSPASGTPAGGPAPQPRPRILLTLLHLAGLGAIGPVVFGVVSALVAAGLGLIVVLGIGLVLLVGLVYVLFGVGWFEVARVDSLYALETPPLERRRRVRPGFGGFLLMLWHQFIDGRMWRALVNFALASVMGMAVIWFFQQLVGAAVIAFAPLGTAETVPGPFEITIPAAQAPWIGALTVVLALAGILGLTLLHRVVAVALIFAPVREIELTERARASAEQREGAVRAADVERTRIERDLHDGVQPRLVSVGMTLGLAQRKIEEDPQGAKELIGEAHTSTKAAITELRQLARGIHASVLDDRGLDAALSALAGRSHIPVHLDVRMDGRCGREAESAVYFAIAESLTNAAKHSRAGSCRVTVRLRPDGALWARVEDDGVGGARVLPGGGLDGIIHRVRGARGIVRLDSPQGGPTALEVSVPCAS
ncbi:sensor histidine kinase [Rothia halotolerans]|uniref:sensor histidine kinase n=1 Tax=Rothia halotolerans TaxID=405770 RepID=UPI00101BC232|nr:sensor histidine kinase [Rothia halotolerans]